MSAIANFDPEIAQVIENEQRRQRDQLVMIASENYTSSAVLETGGSVLTNKYAEGYPGRRYYAGCENVDVSEQLAIDRAKELFGAEHANVQPHSGSQANMAAFFAQWMSNKVSRALPAKTSRRYVRPWSSRSDMSAYSRDFKLLKHA